MVIHFLFKRYIYFNNFFLFFLKTFILYAAFFLSSDGKAQQIQDFKAEKEKSYYFILLHWQPYRTQGVVAKEIKYDIYRYGPLVKKEKKPTFYTIKKGLSEHGWQDDTGIVRGHRYVYYIEAYNKNKLVAKSNLDTGWTKGVAGDDNLIVVTNKSLTLTPGNNKFKLSYKIKTASSLDSSVLKIYLSKTEILNVQQAKLLLESKAQLKGDVPLNFDDNVPNGDYYLILEFIQEEEITQKVEPFRIRR